jgi:hypothetical protein
MGLALSKNQKIFADAFAARSGLDRNVIAAWLRNEEPAIDNNGPRGAYNFLNIGITDSGSLGNGNRFWNSSPAEAGTISAEWMMGKFSVPGFGRASAGIQGIARTAGMSPRAQISAIQHSGWASGGESALVSLYNQAKGGISWGGIAKQIAIGNPATGISGLVQKITGDKPSIPNPIGGVEGAITTAAKKFVYAGAVFGGLLMFLLGVLLIAAEIGLEEVQGPKSVRKIQTKIGTKVSSTRVQRAEKRGEKRGYGEGVTTGRMGERNRQSLRLSEKRAKRAAKQVEQDKKRKEEFGDIPF